MKTKGILLPAILLATLLLSACSDDKTHSATDGGNVGNVRNSANNEDTSSTPNVAADTIHH